MTTIQLPVAAEVLAKPRIRIRHLSVVLFAAAVLLIGGATARIGVAPLRIFEHDVFFLLDNGYRVAQGQVPHRDFSSAWGPAIYLVEAAGLRLAGMRPEGIGYANALFGSLIAIWAFWIGRRCCSPVAGSLIGIYTALLIAAPYPLGWGALVFSHAMVYNRYGYAILGIILVECAVRGHRAGRISTGIGCALLLALKISFAAMAAPFVLLSLWTTWRGERRDRIPQTAALFAAAGAVGLLTLCYLRFDISGPVRDLLMAASGRAKSWEAGKMLLGFQQWTETIPFLLLAALAGEGWADRVRCLRLAFLTLVVDGILISTNQQNAGVPLNGYAAVVLATPALRRFLTAGALPRASAVVVLTTFCMIQTAFLNGISLVGALGKAGELGAIPGVHLDSPRGKSITFAPPAHLITTETGGPAYVTAINDGMNLLRRRTGPGDGILTMDQMSPFNYLLERPSPRGGMAAAPFNYVFSDARHLTPDEFFGDARYVMVRKYSPSVGDYYIETSFTGGIHKIYGAALRERFRFIEETPHWQLFGPK